MKPNELITHLNRKSIKLYLKGDKLVCDAPKNAIDPELLEAIKTNKTELMGLLRQGFKVDAENDEPEFKITDRGKAHPLSYAQKRMMVLHSMQEDESVFNISLAFELKGTLDVPKLKAALETSVDRHELLRTRFTWVNDEPVQVIEKESALNINMMDLHHLEGGNNNKRPLDIVKQELKKPFDISRAPLFRVLLIRKTDNDSILLLVSHYLVADEESMMFVAKQIVDHYNGISEYNGVDSKHQFQYVDYVAWEDAYLNSPAGENQLRFWSDRFKRYALTEKSRSGKADSGIRMFDANSVEFELPTELTGALESVCRENQASLFMMSYSIFTILIAIVYDRSQCYCGTTIVNRSRMELENMMGYFANTLILKSELSENQTFAEYLGTVRTEVLAVFSNGDIPFEYALSTSGGRANPLTRWMFTYAEDDLGVPQFDQLSVHRLRLDENITQNAVAELSLFVRRVENRIICSLLYARDLFAPDIVESLIRDFRKIAEGIVNDPRTPIGDFRAVCESTNSRLERPEELSASDHANPYPSKDDVFRAPRNEVEQILAGIWADLLSVKKISITDNFFSLGGSSFQAVKMFSALHRKTGVKLPISTLFHAPTIELLAQSITDRNNDRQWSSIVPIQTDGERPPLFFVHGAGGNVLLYRELSRRLGLDQPFYGIQAKGLDGSSEMLTTVEAMADYYVKDLLSVQPKGPYYLGGYCLGGQIAYEMARNLSAYGETVAFVAMLDTQRRWDTENGIVLKLRHRYQQITFHLKNFLIADINGKFAFVKEKLAELSRRIHRRSLVYISTIAFSFKLRSDKPLVLMEHLNDHAAERYVALPYDGTITLFRPKRNYAGYEDRQMGWGNGLTKGVDVQNLSIYPAGMLVEPFVGELADKLRDCLELAMEKYSEPA